MSVLDSQPDKHQMYGLTTFSARKQYKAHNPVVNKHQHAIKAVASLPTLADPCLADGLIRGFSQASDEELQQTQTLLVSTG